MTTTKWNLDAIHSDLGFKIKHLMISNVSGNFTKFDVKAQTNGDSFDDASVKADIQVASINTNNEQRDAHLRNADFFEADKHPNITFTSTKVVKESEGEYKLHGNLTIKETTHPVVLDVEFAGIRKDPYGNIKAGFTVNGKINRKDFGVSFNAALETGGVMLGEEVKINAEIQMVKEVVVETVTA